jgi:hypothetical protein
VADDDVGDVLRRDAERAQRGEDELAVGHHARIDHDHPVGVAHQAHRAGHVRHPGVALHQDVDARRARQVGHRADGSGPTSSSDTGSTTLPTGERTHHAPDSRFSARVVNR